MKKILVIRFSSIGDIVLTTPVIRCLRDTYPNSDIHFLVKKQFAAVVSAHPQIDKIHVFDGHLKETIAELQAENFDYIVDLQKNFRSKIILSKLHQPSSTFPKLNYQKWLLVRFKIDKMPDVHIVNRYLEAVKPLGVADDGKGLDFYIEPQQELSEKDLPAGFWGNYVAVVVGGSYETKQIPVQKVLEVCRYVEQPIVIAGGKSDRAIGDEIVKLCKRTVYNACGIFSIQQSASLIKNASLVISSDTGLMHIAAAFHRPIISLWGNTTPKFGMYPYMPETPERSMILENNELSCRPCSKLGFHRCPKKHFRCMNDLRVEGVENFIKNSTTQKI